MKLSAFSSHLGNFCWWFCIFYLKQSIGIMCLQMLIFMKNKTVYLTVISILIIYIILIIYARSKDKTDVTKVKIDTLTYFLIGMDRIDFF